MTARIRSLVGNDDTRRFEHGLIGPDIRREGEVLAQHLERLIEITTEAIEGNEKRFGKEFNFGRNRMAQARGVLEERADALAAFLEKEEVDAMPPARWVSLHHSTAKCMTTPFEASAFFRRTVFGRMKGVVITSATLASLGNFKTVLRELGLAQDTPTIRLESPFDYSRARMIVPKLSASPQDAAIHNALLRAFVIEKALKHTDGGALAYFTARKRMEDILSALLPEQRSIVLAQGDMPINALISEHKRRIDAGEKSVIFGLDSFAEGIDLPGRYCTLLLVDKIPFPAMNEPILAAATEWAEKQGVNPFATIMLPRTGVKLAQVAGRLIRAEGDHGTIYVLDPRLIHSRYGKQLCAGTAYSPMLGS